MSQFVEQGHLGGYVPGGDDATYYPDLWDWLVNSYGIKTVIDVGCGDGVALKYFQRLGCEVRGVEGIPQDNSYIRQHDYTTGPLGAKSGWITHAYQLVWCCEFVEHVEEKYIPNFLETFKCANTVLMTHASPGQAGYHHVNCKTDEYWIGVMAGIGYSFDPNLTSLTRGISARNTSPWNHYARSGLAFQKNILS